MKLGKLINSGIPIFCGALLVVMVGLTFLQVVLRNCFSTGMNWSDEVSQFCMTWLVLFGSIWASKNNLNLNTGLKLNKKLNKRQVCLIDGILDLMLVVVGAVVAYQSASFAFMALGIESLSLPWLKMGWIFFAIPLAMLGLGYYSLKSFFKNLACVFKKD
jgi:TRAP-type C4-dicarboxylate transport system permease small subunit